MPWAPSRESQRLDPNDPRSKPSVFAWLWKASDPMPVVHTSQVLTGNGTASGGGNSSSGAESVSEANKENQDAAKKDLELSQDKEMRFFALWTVSILVVLGVGLCSIKYARTILGGGSASPMGPPGGGQQRSQPHEGGYGAVGGGYPPG